MSPIFKAKDQVRETGKQATVTVQLHPESWIKFGTNGPGSPKFVSAFVRGNNIKQAAGLSGLLKAMGVDLTKYLCAVEMQKPDKHIRVDAGATPALHFDVQ